jgi:CRISPR-associated protein Cmr4
MREAKGILFLYSESFLHPGAGSSTGVIDLPVQREAHTGYPVIAASGLKGSLRDLAERKVPPETVNEIFGAEVEKGKQDNGYAGALAVGDAKLIALPVRSLTRTFFWVTCPLALGRLARDLRNAGITMNAEVEMDWRELEEPEPGAALVPNECTTRERLFCEELDFKPVQDGRVTKLARFFADQWIAPQIGKAYHDKLQCDLAVINNGDFGYLNRFSTQVSARNKLTSRKTTGKIVVGDEMEEGNLWYEETLPPETIFYAPLFAEPARGGQAQLDSGEKVLEALESGVLADRLLQIGGNETLGQGWCLTALTKGGVAQ